MKSNAKTVEEYLASLPEERRIALSAVREVILANLDRDYEECMLWGVAAYVVPHRVWARGHHTDPGKPLMMCGVSSQKNDMVVYMMNVYGGGGADGGGGDPALREWFEGAWAKTGKKLHLAGSGGAGCCVRFKKLDDLALDVIGEAVRRTPAKRHMENQLGMLVGRGKVAGAKKVAKKKVVKKKAARKKVKRSARR